MASTHNIEHLTCVHEIIEALDMHMKLSNLSWGPFAPRSFGIFPMITINFNTISNYHFRDLKWTTLCSFTISLDVSIFKYNCAVG